MTGRVRARARRPVSDELVVLRDWCCRQAKISPDPLWARLAEEIDVYLHEGGPSTAEQPALWDEP
jgi:hypothetical protein